MKMILILFLPLFLVACSTSKGYYENTTKHKTICIEGKQYIQTIKTLTYVSIQPIYKNNTIKECN